MRKNIFELITAWYLRLSRGKSLSQKTIRSWTLVLIPILVVSICLGIWSLFKAYEDHKEYLRWDTQIIEAKNRIDWCKMQLGFAYQNSYKETDVWYEGGLELSYQKLKNTIKVTLEEIDEYELSLHKAYYKRFFNILILPFMFILFILPIVAKRLITWVKSAEN